MQLLVSFCANENTTLPHDLSVTKHEIVDRTYDSYFLSEILLRMVMLAGNELIIVPFSEPLQIYKCDFRRFLVSYFKV
jgi:hypothetical protein